jgi:hypothetical protein
VDAASSTPIAHRELSSATTTVQKLEQDTRLALRPPGRERALGVSWSAHYKQSRKGRMLLGHSEEFKHEQAIPSYRTHPPLNVCSLLLSSSSDILRPHTYTVPSDPIAAQ